jgi:hypothetical protein
MSSSSLFELTDRIGVSVDEAAAITVWTIRMAVAAATETKEVGREGR